MWFSLYKKGSPLAKGSFLFLYPHAGGHAEGSGNSGQYGDDDVENLSPDRILFHGALEL